MAHISSPTQIREIMQKHQLTFHKGLGQNFLFDAFFLNKIVESAELTKEDIVLEVGPGLGVLTTRLAERAGHVIAVEIDQNIIPALKEITADYTNVDIIHKDILKTNLAEILPNAQSVKVVANLPYYITSPIIMKLLTEGKSISSIVIMIQKEVANRIVAVPGTKDYGVLSIAVQYYAQPEKKLLVPAGAFIPAPKVDSTVLHLAVPNVPRYTPQDESLFFKTVKAAFGQRRKTLVNALSSAFSEISKNELCEIMKQCGLKENCRGETLSIDDFIKISNFFCEKKRK